MVLFVYSQTFTICILYIRVFLVKNVLFWLNNPELIYLKF